MVLNTFSLNSSGCEGGTGTVSGVPLAISVPILNLSARFAETKADSPLRVRSGRNEGFCPHPNLPPAGEGVFYVPTGDLARRAHFP